MEAKPAVTRKALESSHSYPVQVLQGGGDKMIGSGCIAKMLSRICQSLSGI